MTTLVWPNGLKEEPKRSDGYGPREQYYINGAWTRKWHTGTDHTNIGKIKSIGAGTVVENSWSSWAGWQVLVYLGVIDRQKTWVRYCHLASKSALSVGDSVALGGLIGTEGMTGQATGAHLHWEIYRGTVDRGDGNGPASTVDPRKFIPKYLSKGLTVIEYAHTDVKATMDKPRVIKPGASFWLHLNASSKDTQASNLVDDPGPYILTQHLYYDGANVGDSFTGTYWWGTPASASSPHYPEDYIVSKAGFIHRKNATFQRSVGSGQAVFLKIVAHSTNKAPINIRRVSSDAWLIK